MGHSYSNCGKQATKDPGLIEKTSFVPRDLFEYEYEYGVMHNRTKLIKIILTRDDGAIQVKFDGQKHNIPKDFTYLKSNYLTWYHPELGWKLTIGRLQKTLTLDINDKPWEAYP